MMTLLSYLFAFLLVIDCLFLALLILVQLPKKEAGAGMAFGGGAADALFGAGSGNALTKLTKYSSIAFFVLVIGLSFLNKGGNSAPGEDLKRAYESTPAEPRPAAKAPAVVSSSNAPALSLISSNAESTPVVTNTNTLAAPVK